MSNSRTSSIAFSLVTSALNGNFGIVGAAQYTSYSKTTIAETLRKEKLWDDESIKRRALQAPEGSFLAFDFVINPHCGREMEGLDYHYSSSHISTQLSHKFANVTLVKSGHEPTPIQLEYAVSKNLATEEYTYSSAVESLKQAVLKMKSLEIEFAGVIADGEFSSEEAIRFHKENSLNFLGRIKSNRKVEYNGEKLSLKQLANRFPYKDCHLSPKWNWRAKKIKVRINELDVFIIIVYRKDKGFWKPFFLVSTFSEEYSLAQLLTIWKSRWGIETVHRFIKQNLGFSKSQCLTISAQQNWANAVLDAFIIVLEVRRRDGVKNWRAARLLAAQRCKNSAVTDALSALPLKFAV